MTPHIKNLAAVTVLGTTGAGRAPKEAFLYCEVATQLTHIFKNSMNNWLQLLSTQSGDWRYSCLRSRVSQARPRDRAGLGPGVRERWCKCFCKSFFEILNTFPVTSWLRNRPNPQLFRFIELHWLPHFCAIGLNLVGVIRYVILWSFLLHLFSADWCRWWLTSPLTWCPCRVASSRVSTWRRPPAPPLRSWNSTSLTPIATSPLFTYWKG